MQKYKLKSDFYKRLGNRLRQARESIGLTQEEVAKSIGKSRSFVALIEKGERKVSLEELFALASLYGRSLDFFLEKERVSEPQRVHYRVVKVDQRIKKTIVLFEELCRDYGYLESIAGIKPSTALPHISDSFLVKLHSNPERYADELAYIVRSELGFGNDPLTNLRENLELLGFKIFSIPHHNVSAGAFLYNAETGPCILINTANSKERQLFTLAHEFGHSILHRGNGVIYDPANYIFGQRGRLPIKEKEANFFAASLLLPEDLVRQAWERIVNGTRPHRHHIKFLAHMFEVSYSTFLYRALKLGLIKGWQYAKLRLPKKNFETEEIPEFEPLKHLPERYKMLVLNAYLNGRITLSEASHYLRTDLIQTRMWIKTQIEGVNLEIDNRGQTQRNRT